MLANFVPLDALKVPSIENDVPNGNGTVTITINNVQKGTANVAQGDVELNLKNYY